MSDWVASQYCKMTGEPPDSNGHGSRRPSSSSAFKLDFKRIRSPSTERLHQWRRRTSQGSVELRGAPGAAGKRQPWKHLTFGFWVLTPCKASTPKIWSALWTLKRTLYPASQFHRAPLHMRAAPSQSRLHLSVQFRGEATRNLLAI